MRHQNETNPIHKVIESNKSQLVSICFSIVKHYLQEYIFFLLKSCSPFQEKENFVHIGNLLFKFSFTDNLWTKNVFPIFNNVNVVPDEGCSSFQFFVDFLSIPSCFFFFFDYLSAFMLVI